MNISRGHQHGCTRKAADGKRHGRHGQGGFAVPADMGALLRATGLRRATMQQMPVKAAESKVVVAILLNLAVLQ